MESPRTKKYDLNPFQRKVMIFTKLLLKWQYKKKISTLKIQKEIRHKDKVTQKTVSGFFRIQFHEPPWFLLKNSKYPTKIIKMEM